MMARLTLLAAGSIRIGDDVLVLTREKDTVSLALLSLSFLEGEKVRLSRQPRILFFLPPPCPLVSFWGSRLRRHPRDDASRLSPLPPPPAFFRPLPSRVTRLLDEPIPPLLP